VLKDAFKTRRFRILTICLLLFVVVSACIAFLASLASRPSEQFLSLKFVRVPDSSRETSGFSTGMLQLQVSNRMSFNVNYRIAAEILRSEKWVPDLRAGSANGILAAHSQIEFLFNNNPDKVRLSVLYHQERELKTIEKSVLKTIPLLTKPYYYAFIRHTLTVYETASDIYVQ